MTDRIRLHLGCGGRLRAGWINVDIQDFGQEVTADLADLPFRDNYAVQVDAIHTLEHFEVWQAQSLIYEWHRVLKPAGVLRVEFPDFEKVCRMIRKLDIKGDIAAKDIVYGALYGHYKEQNPHQTHRWCWSAIDVATLMADAGFDYVLVTAPAYHKIDRDAAVVGIKRC